MTIDEYEEVDNIVKITYIIFVIHLYSYFISMYYIKSIPAKLLLRACDMLIFNKISFFILYGINNYIRLQELIIVVRPVIVLLSRAVHWLDVFFFE